MFFPETSIVYFTTMAHSFQLNTEKLNHAAKLYHHAKSDFGQNSMIQLTGHCDDFDLTVMASINGCAILKLELQNTAKLQTGTSSIDVSPTMKHTFRNTSVIGREFSHGSELFGPKMDAATVSFYSHHNVNYVEAQFVHDNNSKTVHTAATQPINLPTSIKFRNDDVKGVISLTNKTTVSIVKWLKAQAKNLQVPVKVSFSEVLQVVVFTIGDASMTVDIVPQGTRLCADKKPSRGVKALDYGKVFQDGTVCVNCHSFIRSLMICKVPGMISPRIRFHACGILEVDGTSLKNDNTIDFIRLSVVLLNVDTSTGEVAKNSSLSESSGSDITSRVVKSRDRTKSDTVFESRSLSCDSDNSFLSSPQKPAVSPLTPITSEAGASSTYGNLQLAPVKRKSECAVKTSIKKQKIKFNQFD